MQALDTTNDKKLSIGLCTREDKGSRRRHEFQRSATQMEGVARAKDNETVIARRRFHEQ